MSDGRKSPLFHHHDKFRASNKSRHMMISQFSSNVPNLECINMKPKKLVKNISSQSHFSQDFSGAN